MKNMDKYKTYEYSTNDPETGSWCRVYELDKALRAIKIRNMDDRDYIRRLEKENNELKNHAYKDKELAEMRDNLNKMKSEYYRGFPISEDEEHKINEWIEKQPYHVDVASGLMDEQGYLADNMTTDGLHPDFEGKKHIGELVGDYLRANFQDIVNN